MPKPTPSLRDGDVVIVTSAAKLAGLIDEAVERAVRRAVADVRAERLETANWLPAREAERAYGKSRSTLYRWRNENRIGSRKIGRSVYFRPPGWEG